MKPNVLICGKTGSGKSSLVNFLFKKDVAKFSHTTAETRGIKLYESKSADIDINLYDSEGYETGDKEKQRHFQELILGFLGSPQRPDLVWYLVSASGKRFEDADKDYIRMIKTAGYSVCVLISKIDEVSADELQKMRESIIHDTRLSVPVSSVLGVLPALPVSVFCGSYSPVFCVSNSKDVQEFCEWKELIDWTLKNMPVEKKYSFSNAIPRWFVGGTAIAGLAAITSALVCDILKSKFGTDAANNIGSGGITYNPLGL